MTWLGARTFHLAVFGLCSAVALASLVMTGFPPEPGVKDAAQYSAYATHLASGSGYTQNAAFDDWREPGYPLFLGAVYAFFGDKNIVAAALVQALLIACAGYLIFRMFDESGARRAGALAALLVSVLPSFGYYANTTMTETLSVFLYIGIAYCMVRLLRARAPSWGLLCVLGLLCGYATLTRTQFIFFLPLLLVCYVLYRWWKKHDTLSAIVPRMLVPLAVFVILIGSWMFYVHAHTGAFEITNPVRLQESVYYRASRAQLSYGELTQYLAAWVHRQSARGFPSSPVLDAYDFKGLRPGYLAQATTREIASSMEKENIKTILSHPGQYLYGNVIETIKLVFVEEVGLNLYVRVGEYAVLYALFIFGLIQLLRRGPPELKEVGFVALSFIVYNTLVLSFFDAIPRYNTPLLAFYLIVGFVGVALWLQNIKRFPKFDVLNRK